MEINYIKGSKKEFFQFVDLIAPFQKVAILSHTDLDGLSSAVFLEKILEAKNIEVSYIDFLHIKADMVKEVSVTLKEKGIDKVFICDLGVDSIDFEGFRDLREEFDVFLIDHHPMSHLITDWENIIKTDSRDCAAMTVFDLGEGLIDKKEFEWLNCAAIFSDYSHKEQKNLEYIQSIYSEVTYENISSSIPGLNARKCSSALIYYKNNLNYVYGLIKSRKLEEIGEAYEIIEQEVERLIDDFSKNKIYDKSKKLYFYEIISKFSVTSYVVSLISKMSPDETFVFIARDDDYYKISARSTNGAMDVNDLMKRCTFGLEGASGGGHKVASGGVIQTKDLDEFKRRLLE